MAGSGNNSELFDTRSLPDAKGLCFGIVVTEWNSNITSRLLDGAVSILQKSGATYQLLKVPGAFEITSGAVLIASRHKLNGVICLGCVIRGETTHYDSICQSVTLGLTYLNASSPIPFIFGVLTTENEQQALDRCGGRHGHKGEEAAITAIKMAILKRDFGKESKIGFQS